MQKKKENSKSPATGSATGLAVRAKRALAEKTRKSLSDGGLIDNGRQIVPDGEFILIPVLGGKKGLDIVERDLPLQAPHSQSLEKLLSGIMPKGKKFSKSFDIVGTVGILDVPSLPRESQKFAALALKKVYPNLACISTRAGIIEDEFRVRPLKKIWGAKMETIHNENGVRLKLDPSKVYFSPRQASERKRISSLIGKNETILVMFAGCGPYSILIAKEHPDCFVYSIEKNPKGAKYLKENIKLNKLSLNSEAISGDVRKIVPNLAKRGLIFDRILMPLPKCADNFLDLIPLISKKGTFLHFYSFGRDFSDTEKTIAERLPSARIMNARRCGDIAPGKFRLVFDVVL